MTRFTNEQMEKVIKGSLFEYAGISEKIVKVAVLLASDYSNFMTEAIMDVGDGFMMGLIIGWRQPF